MATATPDFVMVQLTAAGQAQAAGTPLRLSNGRRSFVFTGAVAQKVELSYEWRRVLAQAVTRGGLPLFELATATASAEPVPFTAPQVEAHPVAIPVAPAAR